MNLQEAAPVVNRSSEPDVVDSLRDLGTTGWWTTKIGDDGDRYAGKPATKDQIAERLARDEVQRAIADEAKQRAFDEQQCGSCGVARFNHDVVDTDMPSHEFNNEPWMPPLKDIPLYAGSVDESQGSLGRGTGTIHAVDPASHEGAVED